MNRLKKLSFSNQLFLFVALLFLAFVSCFVSFQYNREKRFREELMTTRLQEFNNYWFMLIKDIDTAKIGGQKTALKEEIENYKKIHQVDTLRVTLIREDGAVVFDNFEEDLDVMTNHRNREEVAKAIKYGKGSSTNRESETLTSNFFYSATYYKQNKIIVRTALPYNVKLTNALKIDSKFIYYAAVLYLLLYVVFYYYTHRMGNYIAQLRTFVSKADREEEVSAEVISVFPDNELGEISQHIIKIYQNLNRTKKALYIEREKLVSHLRISKEGLCIFNENMQCYFANTLFTQYSSLIADIPLQKNETVLGLPEFRPIYNFIKKARNEKTAESKKDLEIEKGGRIFDVECVVFQDYSFEISINDVTQEIERERLKHQLTQNIAHELKTPICSIQGYLETMTNSALTPELQQQFIDRCYAQSNRLVNLLRDITTLTKMDESKQNIEKEEVDIAIILQNIQRETALQLDAKKMRVNNMLPQSLFIYGNSSLVYSIFRNLTDNAIAYAGEGTTITIRCFRQDEEFIYFSFSDNGVGVGSEHLNRLFERFYRVDKGRSRKIGGTGLGLAIVKNAVNLHGGNILAKNAQDGGLEFVFSIHK